MSANGDNDETEEQPSPGDGQLVLASHFYPRRIHIVPIAHRPFFPGMTVPMMIEDADLRAMVVEVAREPPRYIGLVLLREDENRSDAETPTVDDLHNVGVIAEIEHMAQPADDGPLQLLLAVRARFAIVRGVGRGPSIEAIVDYVAEAELRLNDELKAYSLSLIKSVKELIKLNPLHREELGLVMSRTNLSEPGRLADFAAALTTASGAELQEILETVNIRARLHKVLTLITKEIDIAKLQVKISKQIEEKLTKQQREFFLHEQLKAIKKELGLEKEGKDTEVEQFQRRLEALTLTEEAQGVVDEELEKLKLLEPTSPEFAVCRNYIDWLTALPWGVFTDDRYDLAKAERILNKDHYGLEDVKERILEFLAVGILKGKIAGSILCFVGPPGVGKTSLGQSIARSIGRNFYRFSIGGVHDEAEIKGHRRTYIGAMPGKFIQTMKVCKSANPVIMIDEIDKIGASYRGDPASALLEVLDPEQNTEFLDHYLDVRFDLSQVFFICTANQLDTIPRPLLDRMEVIKLAGYILKEKKEIARRFLLPRQLKAHGLTRDQLSIGSRAVGEIINGYAREPGVRSLENNIKKIIRKSARRIVAGECETVKVDVDDLVDLLGQRLFTEDTVFKRPQVGVVTGLAWTSMGGDVLYIEATHVKTGKPGFKQTGQLGDVMIESSEIAYTFVRSLLDDDAVCREFFAQHAIHLHVPAGATPKDGPSAGVTMATALYSVAMGKPVKKNVAMTGELTLTGWVMPVGGVKEKTLAAKRASLVNLIFPADNQKDFDELPDHVRKGLKPTFVRSFQEIVEIVF